MESKQNEIAKYECPCGEILTANMLYENENKDTIKCKCGSVWVFEPYTTTNIESDFKTFPKRINGTLSTELINGREVSAVIISRIKEIEEIFSFKHAYTDWLGKNKNTYISSFINQPSKYLGSIELEFHYGDKLDTIKLKREVSSDTSDELLLESLDLFEDHIIEYMRTGELSNEYKFDNFSTYEIEEITRIENYC